MSVPLCCKWRVRREQHNGTDRDQVARETAATQRYRQLEERDHQGNRGETSQSNCVLLVLVVACLVLALCLLLLSGAVLSLSKK